MSKRGGAVKKQWKEGHEGVKIGEKESDSRQKRAMEERVGGEGVEKEEAKQQRSEREMTRGVEGWSER